MPVAPMWVPAAACAQQQAQRLGAPLLQVKSGGDRFDLAWQSAKDELLELYLGARVVYVNTDQIAIRTIVEHYTFGDFYAFSAGLLR